jgi:hypothetical protein
MKVLLQIAVIVIFGACSTGNKAKNNADNESAFTIVANSGESSDAKEKKAELAPLEEEKNPQKELRAVIADHYEEIKSCFQEQYKKRKSLRGKLKLSWRVNSKGQAIKISDDGSTVRSQKVRNCAIKALRSWPFPPPPEGKAYDVSFSWMFKR